MPVRHPHKYEEMLPDEVWAEMERASIIYLPIGPLENHSPHNALGMDALRPWDVMLRAVEISGGIVHPPLYVGCAGAPPSWSREELRAAGQAAYPPSLFVSREVSALLYEELLESLADLGFGVCMAFGGHGPVAALLREIVERLGHRFGAMRIWAGGESSFDLRQVADGDTGARVMDHAGRYETSMLMAHRPELVDLSRFEAHAVDGRIDRVRWQISDPHHLERARVELGERYQAFIAGELARMALELLDEDES